ncbi:hypothetical protein D083_2635 [Dickeya solani RNS 08.23.3.1.A]|nr:hypothetical protein D083_2635 [Dickeya solani RNS 08.23.3.1.A]
MITFFCAVIDYFLTIYLVLLFFCESCHSFVADLWVLFVIFITFLLRVAV